MIIHDKLFRTIPMLALLLSFQPVFPANYTIAVNAGARQGTWNRFYERGIAMDHMYTVISSAYGRNCVNALRRGRAELGFQYCRGHGILNADVGVYTENSSGQAVYNWTTFDRIFDSIKAVGMRPIVEIGFMPPALASAATTISGVWYNGVSGNWNAPKDWTKWETLVKQLVRHCKERYGADEVRNNWFFELWNEPNWMYGGGGGYTGWKTLYMHTANAIMTEDPLIKLGGPAESGGSSNSAVPDFMQWTKQNGIKADFCSYHIYSNDAGNPSHNADALVPLQFHKSLAVAQKREKGFAGLLLNTEYGPSYTYNLPPVHDGEMAASYTAKAIHMFNLEDSATTPPPYTLCWWTISDIYEEFDNRGNSPAFSGCYGLMTRGVPAVAQSWDIAKPAFNAYKILHLLKNYKLSCTGGTIASPGVNAAATISAGNDTICVMVYNHVDNPNGDSRTVDNVTVNLSNVPFTTARVEHWVVDRTRSNSYQTWIGLGSPASPSEAQWTTIANAADLKRQDSVATISITGGTFTKTFSQNLYSVGLIQLTKDPGSSASNPVNAALHLNDPVRIRFARGSLTVDLKSPGSFSVALYSQLGKRLERRYLQGPGTVEMSLRDLSAGAYVLECAGQHGKIVRQIMVGSDR